MHNLINPSYLMNTCLLSCLRPSETMWWINSPFRHILHINVLCSINFRIDEILVERCWGCAISESCTCRSVLWLLFLNSQASWFLCLLIDIQVFTLPLFITKFHNFNIMFNSSKIKFLFYFFLLINVTLTSAL